MQDCELNVVRLPATAGALTAQKRQNSTDDSGFSFIDCSVTGAGQVYLGRAWGPFSRVVYSYTYMSDVIYAPGWFDWAIPARQQCVSLSLAFFDHKIQVQKNCIKVCI
jgi:pectinesterase